MERAVFDPLALFLSPFAIYAIYLVLRARYPLEVEHWTRARVSTMALIGVVVALAGVLTMEILAPRGQGTYIPAHIQNGVLVPGRIQ